MKSSSWSILSLFIWPLYSIEKFPPTPSETLIFILRGGIIDRPNYFTSQFQVVNCEGHSYYILFSGFLISQFHKNNLLKSDKRSFNTNVFQWK